MSDTHFFRQKGHFPEVLVCVNSWSHMILFYLHVCLLSPKPQHTWSIILPQIFLQQEDKVYQLGAYLFSPNNFRDTLFRLIFLEWLFTLYNNEYYYILYYFN